MNIREMQASGHPHAQAVAAALSNADRHPRSTGGIVGYQDGGELSMGPGIAPSTATMNPMAQQYIQRYEAMPLPQLRALAATLGATPQGAIVQRILQQKQMTPQPIAPGLSQPQTAPVQYKRGGEVIAESHPPGKTGYLIGSTPGRADMVHTAPPAGSYVWPADVLSGLGEGNSNAGAQLLERALARGPKRKGKFAFGGGIGEGENSFARHAMRRAFGVGNQGVPALHAGQTNTFAHGLATGLGGTGGARGARGSGPPHAPAPFRGSYTFPKAAQGGKTDDESPTEIMAAHGELITPPDVVRLWGGGDMKKGHDLFDQAVLHFRQKHINDLKSLKPPKKS